MNANTSLMPSFPRVSSALTFARRFKVDLPPGTLFYPQCGKDSGEVLLQFMDSVSEFHFVNRDSLPELPALHCRGEHESRFGSNTERHYLFPSEIVSSVRALSRSHPAFLHQARIYDRGSYEGERRPSYVSTDEIWTVASNDENRVRVYSHRFDELESLKALESISVFYCLGPAKERVSNLDIGASYGMTGETAADRQAQPRLRLVRPEDEYIALLTTPIGLNYKDTMEDRRSMWFEPQNSIKVLEKLNDGGIIIAGACLEARCDLLWRRLGRQAVRWRNGSDRYRRPENFTYANRRFRCLGECGYRTGPVFAWQVFRLP
ncbi:MAG: hypothetical protein ACM3PE_06120 [Deltaproteobacteria bacterium]